MHKRVLDVGQCDPDHASIRRMLKNNFEVQIAQAHGLEDTLGELRSQPFDLVLVNRKLDRDYSDGVDIIKQMKADVVLDDVPVMLVSNHPEHQQLAVDAGAEPGFGKAELDWEDTRVRLSRFLS